MYCIKPDGLSGFRFADPPTGMQHSRLLPGIMLSEEFYVTTTHHTPSLREPRGQRCTPWELGIVSLATFLFIAIGYFIVSAHNKSLAADGFRFFNLSISLDNKVPFIPIFILFYYAYYPVVFSVAILGYRQREVLYQAVVGYMTITAIAWTCFIAFPVQMVQADLSGCTSWACNLVGGMYSVDPGYNVLPSLHVAHSTMVWLFFRRYAPRFASLFAFLLVGITLATVLIKQHYLLDLPAGFLVGYIGYLAGVPLGERVAQRAQRFFPSNARTS